MKKLLLPAFVLVLFVVTGCQPKPNVSEVLDTEAERMQVYHMIMDDPEMRGEMRAMMMEHPDGGMMGQGAMMGEGHMNMGGMHRDSMHVTMQRMMAACAKDSANCNMMTGMMMQHRTMMEQMMKKMNQDGLMDQACYQQMMKNMHNWPKAKK